jgi:hypothetical protein
MPKHNLKSRFEHDHGADNEVLERARLCAALTKPWILPPQDQNTNSKLPENYQSIGSRGTTNIEGRLLLALYPPDSPWFRLQPSSKLKYGLGLSPELVQGAENDLYMLELYIRSVLETVKVEHSGRKSHRSGFRSRKRAVISQIVVTGDALEQLTDDYKIKSYRRDAYVTRRDSRGDILYHILREEIDPLSLEDKELETAGLSSAELHEKIVSDRMQDIYTAVEWQPWSKTWMITQEVNQHVIRTSEEPVSPFFATPYELEAGGHYGRGLVELNLGDLRSVNRLEESMLDFAAIASKQHPIKDYSSRVRDEDFAKPSGTVIQCSVRGGQQQDIGMFSAQKLADFNVVFQNLQRKSVDLSKAFLVEADQQPRGDRVTAFQVQRIALELEGALGGVYAPIADEQQLPLVQRVIWQLQRDKLLEPIYDGMVDIHAITGLTALKSQIDANKLMAALQSFAAMGEQAMSKIDMGVVVDLVLRYTGIYEAGLRKSDEQLQAEMEQQMAAALQQRAGEQTIESAGAVVEGQADAANEASQQEAAA